jgi:Ni/Co efflux regulator RcnB
VNNDQKGRSTNADRGDRRGFDDPRPATNRQTDHDSGRRDDNARDPNQTSNGNNWDRGHDHQWARNQNWRDKNGRDWNRDRRWYDQYRYSHFRVHNDQYFARSRFSVGNYNAPNGYGSRIWIAGDFLPFVYYQDRYFLESFERFELYNPPNGCQWVRVGSDALLVDRDSGYILDVIHDLFW